MLEIKHNLIEACIFPKTLSFIKDIRLLNFISYPFNSEGDVIFQSISAKIAKKSYLTNCVVNAGFFYSVPFKKGISIKNSLSFFKGFFTLEAFLSFFDIPESVLNKNWEDINFQTQASILLAPLFLKKGKIWCVLINDEIYNKEQLQKIGTLFSAKLSNSKDIILYSTLSGKKLHFECESASINI